MLQQKTLFSKGDKSTPFNEQDVYLMLIAEELKSHHNASYPDEYYSVPCKLVNSYTQFKGKDLSFRTTALKKFDGYGEKKKFSNEIKRELLEIFNSERDEALNELLKFCVDALTGRAKKVIFNTVRNNHIENVQLRDLLRKRAVKNDTQIHLLPRTLLTALDTKINMYAKSEANIWAIGHVQCHINLVGEFKARELVESVNQMYELMFNEGKYAELKPSVILSDLKKYVNQAREEYEVIDKIEFNMDSDAYYQSIYTTFKNKLVKISPN